MCVFKTPKAPPPVAIPEPAPVTAQPATALDAGSIEAQTARTAERKRKIAAQASSTFATGGEGLINAPATTTKTLYGQ